MTTDFAEALRSGQCFLFDGSTPTVLYERGVYINRSFDEANLTSPELVRAIHEEFRAGGAQIITTNTWAANRMKLQGYGLMEKLVEINREGARLAREVLQDSAPGWVAGAIGPLGVRIEPWGPTSFDEAQGYFAEQAQALLDGGVDLFVLEGFADLNEIHQAILGIQKVCALPVAAMMTPNDEGQTLYGTEPEWYIRKLTDWGAALVGVNGGSGPAPLLDLLKRFKTVTSCPLILQPSAGLPRMVDGRLLYMASPEYLGEFARQAFQLGARAVGGDAGTSAAHIRSMRGALRQERAFVEGITERAEPETPHPGVPTAERSAFSRKLAAGGFVLTVELVPPKGTSTDKLVEKAEHCRVRGVDAINIPDGPRAMARMSALATSVIIQRRVGMETLMHFACRDRNLLGIQSDLLGAAGLGLQNVLAITGDHSTPCAVKGHSWHPVPAIICGKWCFADGFPRFTEKNCRGGSFANLRSKDLMPVLMANAAVTQIAHPLRDGRYTVDFKALEAAVTPRTRLLVYTSPSNPLGWVATAEEQQGLLDFARRHDLWLLADEVYDRLYYAGARLGNPVPSILRRATRDDAVIAVQSFSKAYCMTGWRLGWIVARRDLAGKAAELNEFLVSHAASFTQKAGEVALAEGEPELARMLERLKQNRDLCLEALSGIAGVTTPVPDGAFYLFPRIDGLRDSFAFCLRLLEETRVGLAPGVAFGEGGEGSVRICYAADRSVLEPAMERLSKFLRSGYNR